MESKKKLGKEQLIQLLKELDMRAVSTVHIIIGGGAAGILVHGLNRQTMDIDVLGGSPPVSAMRDKIARLAEKHSLPETWINDGAKGYARYLPDDFIRRLSHLDVRLSHLQIQILSKIDLFIMKLAAFRPEDIEDIQALAPEKNEIPIVAKAIEKIARFDQKAAMRMDLYLKEKGYV
jgi:hypothetical protein